MITRKGNINDLKSVRELLVNIDMVNGFVKEGSLAAPSIMRIVPRQIELLNEIAHDDKTEMVFVRDSHPVHAVEFKTFGEHCIKGTKEFEVIDELKDFEKMGRTFYKNSTNLIFAPAFQDYLMELNNLERIRLMGCLSEICVLNGAIGLRTYFDQNNKDIEVCVHPDAIDTYSAPGHDADEVTIHALNMMKANGVKVLERRR